MKSTVRLPQILYHSSLSRTWSWLLYNGYKPVNAGVPSAKCRNLVFNRGPILTVFFTVSVSTLHGYVFFCHSPNLYIVLCIVLQRLHCDIVLDSLIARYVYRSTFTTTLILLTSPLPMYQIVSLQYAKMCIQGQMTFGRATTFIS